jgi:hypothetical protein
MAAHKRDKCFVCKCENQEHRGDSCRCGKCKGFEFVAASARSDKDINFCATFQSESGPRMYNVVSWKQGDWSCQCVGWRNHRTCKHIDAAKNNPDKHKNKATQADIDNVKSMITEIEYISNQLDAGIVPDLAAIEAKISYQTSLAQVGGEVLAEKLATLKQNMIRKAAGEDVKKEAPKPQKSVVSAASPFGD